MFTYRCRFYILYVAITTLYIRAIFTYFTVGYFVTVQLQRCSGLHTTTGGNGELKVCARSLTRSLARVCVCLFVYYREPKSERGQKKPIRICSILYIYSVLVCL